ncbi:MAG TPA: preprotein translocase subunit YajC [Dehalococcoidales bacterium]|nr:preprotein translocase subunit YajC [Dehalococcoidales bacterium]
MRKSIRLTGIVAALLAFAALLTSCTSSVTTDTTTATSGSSTTSFLIMIGFIAVLFILMYFLTIRPQRKRQKEQASMLNNLQRGDRIVTIGGMIGTVENVSEDSVVLKTEGGTTMRFLKSAIATKTTGENK